MTKLSTISAIVTLVVVALGRVESSKLRQYEPSRVLASIDTSDSGSVDSGDSGSAERFLEEFDTSVDGSSLLGEEYFSSSSVDTSEDGSNPRFLVDVESSIDGSALLDSLEFSEAADSDSEANDEIRDNSEDDGEDDGDASYQPGTVKPADIGESGEFDKSDLSWWK
ncbi:unnamed protein product [Phytophthora lilii]|uniref:Unnamed protein product n=1 Tax=Phytophthora lilii TaxID=2077276 RepID=A0A9W6WFD4_9STRA|nr:unnamed protein product [Phytophthora lilii]